MKTKTEKSNRTGQNSNANNSRFGDTGFFAAQPKLKVGEPGDKYEQEADRVADEVVNSTTETSSFFSPVQPFGVQAKTLSGKITPFVQKNAEEEETQTKIEVQCQEEEEEEAVQTQPMEEEEEEIQPKLQSQSNPNSVTENVLLNSRGAGSSLDPVIETQMENGFGADFSNVRIHTDSTAVQMNKELGAQAFASGNDIYFNSGGYSPGTQNGKRLLAHELTHTIQQGASTIQNFVQREVTETTAPPEAAPVEESAETCDEATQREKEAFINHGIYGPESMTPADTQAGGFEAAYNPATEVLNISVRGKTRFVDGLSMNGAGVVSAYERNLRELALLLNYLNDTHLKNTVVNDYYTWNETQKAAARSNFRQRIAETVGLWEADGWISFHMADPCWDDIFANVDISIQVQDEGEAAYSGANSAGNDHLQVTVVKNPERSELDRVQSLVRSVVTREENDRMMCIDSSARYTTGARVDYNRFGSGANTNPYDSEMTLSNLSLQNTPSEENNYRSLLRRQIFFERDESELGDNDRRALDGFMRDFSESDNVRNNSRITLVGYASRLGSTAYNTTLVNDRLQSVVDYLRRRRFPNIDTRISQINQSDTVAENNPDTSEFADWFRRVDLIVGTGELQNTVAHEFGHVFGLRDEYATVGTSFTGTGTAPGTEVSHSDMAEALGVDTVLSENSDNIMAMGNEVRSQHYATFGWALQRLTHRDWRIF